ncbi:MAG: hypothetical protein ABW215_01820 [Kibdelosporangium sp.]
MINVDAAHGFRRARSIRRCPACRRLPEGPYEHEDMLADLSVEWWVISHGRIRRARFCCRCAPETVLMSVDCGYCSDGPLVAFPSPNTLRLATAPGSALALVRTALSAGGWIFTPAGEWLCAGCRPQTGGR